MNGDRQEDRGGSQTLPVEEDRREAIGEAPDKLLQGHMDGQAVEVAVGGRRHRSVRPAGRAGFPLDRRRFARANPGRRRLSFRASCGMSSARRTGLGRWRRPISRRRRGPGWPPPVPGGRSGSLYQTGAAGHRHVRHCRAWRPGVAAIDRQFLHRSLRVRHDRARRARAWRGIRRRRRRRPRRRSR